MFTMFTYLLETRTYTVRNKKSPFKEVSSKYVLSLLIIVRDKQILLKLIVSI